MVSEKILQLKECINYILSLDLPSIYNKSVLGINSFKDVEKELDALRKLCFKLKDFDFSITYEPFVENSLRLFEGITQILKKIESYDFSNPEIATHTGNLIHNIKEYYMEIHRAYGIIFFVDSDENLFINEAKNKINELEEKVQSANKIIERMKLLDSQHSISFHSAVFKDEASKNKNTSNIWLAAFIILAFITILLAISAFVCSIVFSKIDSLYSATSIALSKIFIFSLLTYCLLVCIKNYRACMHNYIVNKHRQNCLDSFQTFSDASIKDQEVKRAILIQATQTIFAHSTSGYSSPDTSENTSFPNKIVELIPPSSLFHSK